MRDELLIQLERQRSKSTFERFFSSPSDVLREKPLRLIYISGSIAIGFAIVAYYLGLSLTDIAIFAALISMIPPGIFDTVENNRVRKLEAEFPALLRDIALSRRAGMSLEVAVSVTARGEYGALTPAIRWIDNLMSWGVTFEDAQTLFAKKYPTPLIKRSVSIILEAARAGGEIGDILETVADDAKEMKTFETKRRAETYPYIIICYLSFFVFVAVIVMISTHFMPVMEEVAGRAAVPGIGGFAASPEDIALYKKLFFHALIIQGFFAGIVTGKVGEGRVTAGLKHSIIFVAVAIITYSFIL